MDFVKISEKGQTTIPASVRTHLGLNKGDLVSFSVLDNHSVLLRKFEPFDYAYHQSLSEMMSPEWDSPEDNKAFNKLKPRKRT